jgi:hypothetical protein
VLKQNCRIPCACSVQNRAFISPADRPAIAGPGAARYYETVPANSTRVWPGPEQDDSTRLGKVGRESTPTRQDAVPVLAVRCACDPAAPTRTRSVGVAVPARHGMPIVPPVASARRAHLLPLPGDNVGFGIHASLSVCLSGRSGRTAAYVRPSVSRRFRRRKKDQPVALSAAGG